MEGRYPGLHSRRVGVAERADQGIRRGLPADPVIHPRALGRSDETGRGLRLCAWAGPELDQLPGLRRPQGATNLAAAGRAALEALIPCPGIPVRVGQRPQLETSVRGGPARPPDAVIAATGHAATGLPALSRADRLLNGATLLRGASPLQTMTPESSAVSYFTQPPHV